MESQDLPSTLLTLKVSRRSIKHVVGKGRHMRASIEAYRGSVILMFDCNANLWTMQIWGGQCELAKVVVLALSFGFCCALETISRNDITRLLDPT